MATSSIKAKIKGIRELLTQKRGREARLAAQALLDDEENGGGASADKFEAELCVFAGRGSRGARAGRHQGKRSRGAMDDALCCALTGERAFPLVGVAIAIMIAITSAGKGAYLEGDYTQAKELYRRAITVKPDSAAGYLVGWCTAVLDLLL